MEALIPTDLKEFSRCGRSVLGFTLIEVTIAIGVVSFGMIAILGLLPDGLKTFRTAMDTSVGAQIAQKVLNDAQQQDFDTLTANGSTSSVRYFDDQGDELSASNKALAIYNANTRILVPTGLPGSSTNTNLATITIQVANNPGNLTLPATNNLWLPGTMNLITYSSQISKNK